jgi:hypothetical protein
MELHLIPSSQERIAGYRIGEEQSGDNGDQSKASPPDWLWLGMVRKPEQIKLGLFTLLW